MRSKKPHRHAIEALETRRLFSTYLVSSAADSGAGTLRQAILDANANVGADLITFNIVGAANVPPPIKPTSVLPSITDTVTIDGTTQPNYAGTPIVQLAGDFVITPADVADIGLNIAASDCVIKGLVFTKFKGSAIYIASGSRNVIQGNYIGVDILGNTAAGNGTGVTAYGDANVIGGTTAADRNVISGNTTGINLTTRTNGGNLVQGNYIGTNASGTAAIGNGTGIKFTIALGTVGGSAAAGNVIAGNTGAGINVADLSPSGQSATISYNRIGVSATGAALGNGGAGIRIGAAVNAPQITTVTQNEIANNTGAGVAVTGNSLVAAKITQNSIYSNGGLGIDLGTTGVTANDANDADTGPNELLNMPTIASVNAGTTASALLTFAGQAGVPIQFDLYVSPAADPSGYGEGKTWIASATTTTSSFDGTAQYNVQIPVLEAGQVLTATATNLNTKVTSEFSQAFTLNDPVITTRVLDVTGGGYALAAGRTVFIDANDNAVLDSGEQSVVTNSTGDVSFGAVTPGHYVIREILPAGWGQLSPAGAEAWSIDAPAGSTASTYFYTRNTGLTPDITGPTSVAEESSITLDASSSTITTGTITKYEWDLNYVGGTFSTFSTGSSFVFSAVGLDGPTTRQIALRVTDSSGDSVIKTQALTITNANPTATFTGGGTVILGSASTVNFTNSTDASPADVAAGFTYSYDFNNDGDFVDAGDVLNSTLASASKVFATSGTKTVHGRITDKDGGYTDYTTTVTIKPLPPAMPTAPSATADSSSQITFRWTDASSNETGFRIQRSTSSTFSSISTFTVGANVTQFVDTGRAANTTYYYRVQAYNGGGSSSYTTAVFAKTLGVGPIIAPSGLTGTAGRTSMALKWLDNSNNEAGFEIEYSTTYNFATYTTVSVPVVNATSFTVTGLTPYTWYYFRIRAVNGSTVSAWSPSIKIKTLK